MAILINKRPHNYCFTGNPVHYELFSQFAVDNPETYFEIKVLYDRLGTGTWLESVVLPYNPTLGYAQVNVQDILDSVLEYEVPSFPADEAEVVTISKQTAKFYIKYREITEANPDPSWDNSESGFVSIVLKGGLDYFIYRGNNFWLNYYDVKMPFLTWQQSGRLAGLTERMYLAWFNKTTASSLGVVVTVTYTDTSTQTKNISLAVLADKIAYIPTGAAQLELDLLQLGSDIHYWEVQVMDQSDGGAHVPASELFRYYADNRNDYNDVTLHYRNSLGGLDSLRVRGVITPNLEYDFTLLARTVRPDYYSGDYINPQLVVSNSGELVTYKGDIGHLGKEEQDRLRDSHIIRETWWEINKKWWPILITTANGKLGASDAQRWNYPIEYQFAVDRNYFYTPKDFDFGDAVFTDNVCRAYIGGIVLVLDMTGATATITITFTEEDPDDASTAYWYQIIGFHDDPIAADTANQPLVIADVPKELLTTIQFHAQCANGYKGPVTSKQIDTREEPTSPGTGGTSELTFRNRSHTAISFYLYTTDAQNANGYAGEKQETTFYLNDGGPMDITMELGYSPISAKWGTVEGVITGPIVVFYGVTISGPEIITID